MLREILIEIKGERGGREIAFNGACTFYEYHIRINSLRDFFAQKFGLTFSWYVLHNDRFWISCGWSFFSSGDISGSGHWYAKSVLRKSGFMCCITLVNVFFIPINSSKDSACYIFSFIWAAVISCICFHSLTVLRLPKICLNALTIATTWKVFGKVGMRPTINGLWGVFFINVV